MNLTDTRESNFLPTFAHLAMLATLFGALYGSGTAFATDPYQIGTGTCGGCSICLQLGAISPTPIRESASCNNLASCGANPFRFADITCHRGLLQGVSHSIDGSSCPQNLFAYSQWSGTNVFFTGPPGETTVMTRVHYVMSNAMVGDTGLNFSARFQNQWASAIPMPQNVTNFEIVSPLTEIGLDFWRSCDARIESVVGNGSTCYILHFPLNTPIFDLPPGYNANSPELGIVDNIWHGLDIVGDWNASTGTVPCFSSMSLLHSVSGDLTVDDDGLTAIDLGTLADVGGNVTVSNNGAATNIDLTSLISAGESVTVSNNGAATNIDLTSLINAGESVVVSNNGAATNLELPSLKSTGGTVVVSNNGAATNLELPSLTSTGGTVVVSNNGAATIIDLSGLVDVGGDVNVEGNGTESERSSDGGGLPLAINLASLTVVDGSLNVSANAEDTTLTLGPSSMVNGNLTLETKVTGTLDLSTAGVTGNIDLKTRDADSILIRTPGPGSSTALDNKRAESSITATLPADTFSRGEVLTVERIDVAATPVLSALDVDSQPIRISPMAAYHVDVVDDPTLLQNATLVLEVNVNGLSAGMQAALLAGVADNRIMLASRGDGGPPPDLYQAFEICPTGTPPSAGGCAAMELLDADHNPLPPGSPEPPAFVRFTAVTDHFSDYAIAIRIEPGDINGDGAVDVNDLLLLIGAWGPCDPPPADCPADINGDGTVDVNDLLLLIGAWG